MFSKTQIMHKVLLSFTRGTNKTNSISQGKKQQSVLGSKHDKLGQRSRALSTSTLCRRHRVLALRLLLRSNHSSKHSSGGRALKSASIQILPHHPSLHRSTLRRLRCRSIARPLLYSPRPASISDSRYAPTRSRRSTFRAVGQFCFTVWPARSSSYQSRSEPTCEPTSNAC